MTALMLRVLSNVQVLQKLLIVYVLQTHMTLPVICQYSVSFDNFIQVKETLVELAISADETEIVKGHISFDQQEDWNGGCYGKLVLWNLSLVVKEVIELGDVL